MNLVIVAAADQNFADMAKGLIQSIRKRQPAPQPVAFIDCGIDASMRAWLEAAGVSVVTATWDAQTAAMPGWFRATSAKARLPELVPGYDRYLWIDSDAWVQGWFAVDMLGEAAAGHDVAVVPQSDRAYPETIAPLPGRAALPSIHLRSILQTELFDRAIMRRYSGWPQLNSGVFCARAESPLWHSWRARRTTSLERVTGGDRSPAFRHIEAELRRYHSGGRQAGGANGAWKGTENLLLYWVDEVSFNVALLDSDMRLARLPARCNWMCSQALPVLDADGTLCEAGYPYAPLGIVHMTGRTKGRHFMLRRTDGTKEERALGYPGD